MHLARESEVRNIYKGRDGDSGGIRPKEGPTEK